MPAGALSSALMAAAGHEDLVADHFVDHHQVIATSFLRIPMPKSRIFHMIMDPLMQAWQWPISKFDNVWHHMFDKVALPDQARMVDYYAESCGHCKNLNPSWNAAADQWGKLPDANKLVWEQKQCLDANWQPGRDHAECQAQNIHGFPTIKFFEPGATSGDVFREDRAPDTLVHFAKTGVSPEEPTIPRGDDADVDLKIVDFYAASCPHCKSLDKPWDEASKQWNEVAKEAEDYPNVKFEKKECYDDHWKPGKDHAECQKFHVQGFPTIKLLAPSATGHGFASEADFDGPRTSEGLIKFLKKEADLEPPQELGKDGKVDIQVPEHFAHARKMAVEPADTHKDHVAVPVKQEETRGEAVAAGAAKADELVAADGAAKKASKAVASLAKQAEAVAAKAEAEASKAEAVAAKAGDVEPTVQRPFEAGLEPATVAVAGGHEVVAEAVGENANDVKVEIVGAEAISEAKADSMEADGAPEVVIPAPEKLAQAVKAAMVPLQLISCLPPPRRRSSPSAHQVRAQAPKAVAHFL